MEEKNTVTRSSTQTGTTGETKKTLDTKGWILLFAAVSLSAFVWFGFVRDGGELPYLPGAGAACFLLLFAAVALFSVGKQVKRTAAGVMLLVTAAALSLTYAVFANPFMRLLNLPVIVFTIASGLFALSGLNQSSIGDPRMIPETILRSMAAFLSHLALPLRAAMGVRREKAGRIAGLGIGLLVCLPLIAAVLALLSSADSVFSGLLDRIGIVFSGPELPRLIVKLIMTGICALILFSVLHTLQIPSAKLPELLHQKGILTPPAYAAILLILDAVYAMFVYIQFRYLFGGAGEALPAGGYAEYARTGFFQLTAVSLINLAAVLITACRHPGHRMLAALSGLTLGLTAVILASAVLRMTLYISVFGLSFLRLLTLWGMAVIAAALCLTAVRILKPGFSVFPYLLAITLGSWIVFNYSNVDARIAGYNADAYLKGSVETIDLEYLSAMSPDALPALERLRAAEVEGAAEAAEKILSAEKPVWWEWSLSWLKAGR